MEYKILNKKNGNIDWNPAGIGGSTSGTITDISVFMTLQMDVLGRTYMPFNFGARKIYFNFRAARVRENKYARKYLRIR